MWRTGMGVRVLKKAEWELFREGIGRLWDEIETNIAISDELDTGVAVFDRLTPNQQLAMLALVGRALRDKDVPAPDLTAITEGTVAAVFMHLCGELIQEIEIEDDLNAKGPDSAQDVSHLRRLIRLAYRKCKIKIGLKLPDETSRDQEDWKFMIECLESRILWDEDFRDGDFFLDADPAKRQAQFANLGIDPDYFIDIAPDPTDEQMEEVRNQLREITDRPMGHMAAGPEVDDLFLDGMIDIYHGLFVGPCERHQIVHEASCRLMQEISCSPDQFDCSYEEWLVPYGAEVRRVAAQGWPGPADPKLLSPSQFEAATAATASGEPFEIEPGTFITPREGKWIIMNRSGEFLIDVGWNTYSSDPEYDAPLAYDTPLEAGAAYLWSEAISETREARYTAAMRTFGREERE